MDRPTTRGKPSNPYPSHSATVLNMELRLAIDQLERYDVLIQTEAARPVDYGSTVDSSRRRRSGCPTARIALQANDWPGTTLGRDRARAAAPVHLSQLRGTVDSPGWIADDVAVMIIRLRGSRAVPRVLFESTLGQPEHRRWAAGRSASGLRPRDALDAVPPSGCTRAAGAPARRRGVQW